MSTVVWVTNAIRIMVRTKDHDPMHVHVVSRDGTPEFRINIETMSLMDDTEYGSKTVNKIMALIELNRDAIVAKWKEYHGEEEV